jgi:hypothetical protein
VSYIDKLLSFVYLAVFGINIVEWFTARNMDNIKEQNMLKGGPLMVAQWLTCCATNRKVAGSIPDGVIGIFH